MADKKITVGLDFEVNTKKLNELKKQMQEIQNMSLRDFNAATGSTGTGVDKQKAQLKELKQSAKEFEQIFTNAFDVSSGTYDLAKLNKELNNIDLNKKARDFKSLGAAGEKAFLTTANAAMQMQKKTSVANETLNNMFNNFKKTFGWSISSTIINNLSGSVQKAWTYSKKLDKSLNNIRIVTKQSNEQMKEFAKYASQSSAKLAKSTTDYTDAALIYYQQGLADQEVKARTDTTLKTANVTGQSTSAVSEELTAVWNGYKVSAAETEKYVDKLAAVAASTASDLQELSTGMSKVASTAAATGVDIDQLSAQMSTIISVTRQAPESVGTALKTIYARLGDLSINGELGEVSGKLASIGINVLDSSGELRDMGTVIEEVAAKWDTMTAAQKNGVAIAMAGKRQYNNLFALFENTDMYDKAKETAQNSLGELQAQQDIYLDSMSAKLAQLSQGGENIIDSLFDIDSVKPAVETLTDITNTIAKLIDVMGGGKGVIKAFGGILLSVFSKNIGNEVSRITTNLQNVFSNKAAERAKAANIKKYQSLGADSKDAAKLADMSAARDRNMPYLNEEDQKTYQNSIDTTMNSMIAKNKLLEERLQLVSQIEQKMSTEEQLNADILLNEEQRANKVKEMFSSWDSMLEDIKTDTSAITDNIETITTLGQSGIFGKDVEAQTNNISKLFTELNNSKQQIQTNAKLQFTDKGFNEAMKDRERVSTQNLHNAMESQGIDLSHSNTVIDILNKHRGTNEKWRTQTIASELHEAGIIPGVNTAIAKDLYNRHNVDIGNVEKFDERNGIDTAVADKYKQQLSLLQELIDTFFGHLKINVEDLLKTSAEEEAKRKADADAARQTQLGLDKKAAVGKIGTGATRALGGLSQLTMAFSSLNTVMDENATFSEKFMATMMGLPMVLGGVGSLMSGLRVGLEGLAVATSTVEMTTVEASAMSVTGILAVETALGPLYLVILGVAAAIGLLVGAGVALYKMYNKQANVAKKANEQAKQNAETLNTLKSRYDNLKSSIESLSNAEDTLKKCKKGTQEWTEAVMDLNSQVLNLIKEYPNLAAAVTTDKDGVMHIDEGSLNEELEKQQENVLTQSRVTALSQSHAREEQAKADLESKGRGLNIDDGGLFGVDDQSKVNGAAGVVGAASLITSAGAGILPAVGAMLADEYTRDIQASENMEKLTQAIKENGEEVLTNTKELSKYGFSDSAIDKIKENSTELGNLANQIVLEEKSRENQMKSMTASLIGGKASNKDITKISARLQADIDTVAREEEENWKKEHSNFVGNANDEEAGKILAEALGYDASTVSVSAKGVGKLNVKDSQGNTLFDGKTKDIWQKIAEAKVLTDDWAKKVQKDVEEDKKEDKNKVAFSQDYGYFDEKDEQIKRKTIELTNEDKKNILEGSSNKETLDKVNYIQKIVGAEILSKQTGKGSQYLLNDAENTTKLFTKKNLKWLSKDKNSMYSELLKFQKEEGVDILGQASKMNTNYKQKNKQIKNFTKGSSYYSNLFDEGDTTKSFVSGLFGKGDELKNNLDQASSAVDFLKDSFNDLGYKGSNAVRSIFEENKNMGSQIADAYDAVKSNQIEISNPEFLNEFKKALEEEGVKGKNLKGILNDISGVWKEQQLYSNDTLNSQIGKVSELSNKITDLKSVLNEEGTLDTGSILDKEGFDKLKKYLPNAKDYFTRVSDNEWAFVGDSNQFKEEVNQTKDTEFLTHEFEHKRQLGSRFEKFNINFADLQDTPKNAQEQVYTDAADKLLTQPENLLRSANIQSDSVSYASNVLNDSSATEEQREEAVNALKDAFAKAATIQDEYTKGEYDLGKAYEISANNSDSLAELTGKLATEQTNAKKAAKAHNYVLSKEAESLGTSADVVKTYSSLLKKNNKNLKISKKNADQLAMGNIRMTTVIRQASSFLEENSEILHSNNKNTLKYAESLNELTGMVQTFFNNDDIDANFVEKNLNSIESALKGDKDALATVRKELAKFDEEAMSKKVSKENRKEFKKEYSKLNKYIQDEIKKHPNKIPFEIDDKQFRKSLNKLTKLTGKAADEMLEKLQNTYNMTIDYKKKTVVDKDLFETYYNVTSGTTFAKHIATKLAHNTKFKTKHWENPEGAAEGLMDALKVAIKKGSIQDIKNKVTRSRAKEAKEWLEKLGYEEYFTTKIIPLSAQLDPGAKTDPGDNSGNKPTRGNYKGHERTGSAGISLKGYNKHEFDYELDVLAEINRLIEEQKNLISTIGDETDRLYGKHAIQGKMAQIEALKNENKLLDKRIAKQREAQKEDDNELKRALRKAGYSKKEANDTVKSLKKYDKNGNLVGYDYNESKSLTSKLKTRNRKANKIIETVNDIYEANVKDLTKAWNTISANKKEISKTNKKYKDSKKDIKTKDHSPNKGAISRAKDKASSNKKSIISNFKKAYKIAHGKNMDKGQLKKLRKRVNKALENYKKLKKTKPKLAQKKLQRAFDEILKGTVGKDYVKTMKKGTQDAQNALQEYQSSVEERIEAIREDYLEKISNLNEIYDMILEISNAQYDAEKKVLDRKLSILDSYEKVSELFYGETAKLQHSFDLIDKKQDIYKEGFVNAMEFAYKDANSFLSAQRASQEYVDMYNTWSSNLASTAKGAGATQIADAESDSKELYGAVNTNSLIEDISNKLDDANSNLESFIETISSSFENFFSLQEKYIAYIDKYIDSTTATEKGIDNLQNLLDYSFGNRKTKDSKLVIRNDEGEEIASYTQEDLIASQLANNSTRRAYLGKKENALTTYKANLEAARNATSAAYQKEINNSKTEKKELLIKKTEAKMRMDTLKVDLDKAENEANAAKTEYDKKNTLSDTGFAGFNDYALKKNSPAYNLMEYFEKGLSGKKKKEFNKLYSSDTATAEDFAKIFEEYGESVNYNGKYSYDELGKMVIDYKNIEQDYTNAASALSDINKEYSQAQLDYAKTTAEIEQFPEKIKTYQNYVDSIANKTDKWSEKIEDVQQQILDTEQEFVENTAEKIELTKEQLELELTDFGHSISEVLTGSAFGIKDLQEGWDNWRKRQDAFIDEVNKAYEIDKLTRAVDKEYDSLQNNIRGQQKLRDVMNEQLDILKEKDKITQYDLDRANAIFELTKAQIALEEAKNNKSKLKLRRDASGNYSYQYVADDNDLADKQQAVEDAKNRIWNLDKNQINSTTSSAFTAYADFYKMASEASSEYGVNGELPDNIKNKFYDWIYNNANVFDSSLEALENVIDVYDLAFEGGNSKEFILAALGKSASDRTKEEQAMINKLIATGGLDNEEQLTALLPLLNIMNRDDLFDANGKINQEVADEIYDKLVGEKGLEGIKDAAELFEKLGAQTETDNQKIISSVTTIQADVNEMLEIFRNSNDNSGILSDSQQAVLNAIDSSVLVTDMSSQLSVLETLLNTFDTETSAFIIEQANMYLNSANLTLSEDFISTISGKTTGAATGGELVDWGTKEGKLAKLHAGELVVNSDLVKKMKAFFNGDIEAVKTSIWSFDSIADKLKAIRNSETLDQNVTISATFPNVSDHNEIEEALNNLVNKASQYALRTN